MNKRQAFYFFIIFLFLLAIIAIPLWLDRVMPYLKPYMQAAADTAGRWSSVLKGIAGK